MTWKVRYFILLVFLFVIHCYGHAQHNASVVMVLSSTSHLEVKGNANVTDFRCTFQNEYVVDTLDISVDIIGDVIYCSDAVINFLVDGFDCGHAAMNKDFRKTLNSDTHPYITLSIDRIFFDGSGSGDNYVEAEAELTIKLADQSNTYTVPFDNITFSDRLISFRGRQDVTFTSFGLDPPTALFGLVKVEDELDIMFDFDIKLIKKGP